VGRGRTILVVEDNPKVRALSVARIRDLGFHVIEAVSGDDAFEQLSNDVEVDLVFSDLVMPGTLSGYDLATKIAKAFPDLKVLLTSGYASDVVEARMPHDRSYDILHKPFRQTDLIARLQALLDGDGVD
jgi:CheY-like chemotaxis protein